MKKLIKIQATIWSIILLLGFNIGFTYGQDTIPELVINEYYFMTPLSKVFDDLETKYGIQLSYDSLEISKHRIDCTFYNTTAKGALHIICRKIPTLKYHYENGVIVISSYSPGQHPNAATNTPHFGASEQENITVTGEVKDKLSGESLPFTKVKVRGTSNGTVTNIDGYFTLFNVPSDTSTLEIRYIGYNDQLFYLNPKIADKNVRISLSPQKDVQELGEVVVEGKRKQDLNLSDGISTIKLTPRQIADLPSLGEKDIFRAFQLMPGISGSNESSAGLFVRGGTPDQNLILFDGFTVYHQEHLFGMFSAFNSNAIKDVSLHKGGFESKYGGRLSSVMDIVGKTGNENEFNIGGEISLLSFNGFAEIPLNKKGSIFIAGRRSFKGPLYNMIFDAFNEDNSQTATAQVAAPPGKGNRTIAASDPTSYFYDINAKITYRPTDKDILSLSFFNGQDNLDNSREISRSRNGVAISGGLTDLTKWGNWGTSLKWSRKWNNKFYSNSLFSFSNYYSLRERKQERTITINGESTSFSQGSLEDNDLNDFSYKLDNEYKFGQKNQLEFGLEYTHYDIKYDYIQNDTTTILNMDDQGNLLALYLQDRWTPFKKLSILPSVRASYYDLTNKLYFEPRFQATYDLTKKVKLKGAWGKYYQFANRIVREDILSGSRDFWVLSDGEEIPVSESMHYIAGLSYERKDWLFSAEGYYKDLKGLSEYTLRFSPMFGQGEIDFSSYFYDGVGYSQGLELLVQKKFGNFTGWAGYTLGQARYNFPIYGDGYFAAAHDVTHEFKLTGVYKLKKWTFSGTWIYATGQAYTEPLGGYSIALADGSTSDFILTGSKNGSRYPDYHRLDLAVKYNFKLGKTANGYIGASLFNVYNQQNIWYKEFEVDQTGLTETNVNLLGITPNITLSIKLR